MLALINLDSATERRRHMVAQLAGVTQRFERVGFDGRTRPAHEIDAWCRERFGNLTFDFDLMSGAEVGCWLSHLTAWDLLRSRRAENACTVLEDDVRLAPDFAAATAVLERASPFDVVYLGTSSRNISQRRRTCIGHLWAHAPVGTVFNTWGYVVTRAYVERFFATPTLRIAAPIDHFLGGNGRRARPRIAVLQPAVVTEEEALADQSQIEPHTFRFDRWKMVERTRRRLLSGRIGDFYSALYRWL